MLQLKRRAIYHLEEQIEEWNQPQAPEQGIWAAVLGKEDAEVLPQALRPSPALLQAIFNTRHTRTVMLEQAAICTICIPHQHRQTAQISIYLTPGGIVFFLCNEAALHRFPTISLPELPGLWTLESVLDGFFQQLLENDLIHLEEWEERIGSLEERILSGTTDGINHQLMELRRSLLFLHNYYAQTLDAVSQLISGQNGVLEQTRRLEHQVQRLGRLRDHARLLRDYAMQTREIYQAQLDLKQNRTMTFLTCVTTIFLPLTLITGWYGMNFSNMPELHWQYGYELIIAVSALVLAVCLWIFKKKKFF